MTVRTWILAIDFGTSYTVAAAQVEGRSAEVIEIDGNRRMPSVVLAEDGRYVVGKLADELSAAYPGRTLRAPKRRIGDPAPIVLDGEPHQVVDLIAALLEHVYLEAVRQYGNPPAEVRLTHPAVWVRPQLNRLLEAATKAGIPHAVLVPEPVAAALAYATEVGVPRGAHVAVYDLGGGTFDTAVVTPANFGFQIVGRPGGDPAIGGELFDELLQQHVGEQLDPPTWEAIQFSEDPTWRRLRANLTNEIRRAKEMLSGYPLADILVPVPGELVQRRVSRQEYESLIAPHLDSTIDLLERCVREAGVDPASLAAVYLVGGASRTPLVSQLVQERLPGIPISRRGDPKTSTAIGAALAVRSGQSTPTPIPPSGAPTPTPTPLIGAGSPGAKPVSVTPDLPTQPALPATAPVAGAGAAFAGAPTGAPAFSDRPTQQLPPTPPAASGPPTAVQPVIPPGGEAPRRRRGGLWVALALLVVVLGAGAGIAFAMSRDSGTSSSSSTTATTAGPTTTAAAGTERCVRQDIDFAALRDGPDKANTQLDRIPAGTCHVPVSERVQGPSGTHWLHVTFNGSDGYSAESNFLPADVDPGSVTTAAAPTAAPTTADPPATEATTTSASGLLPEASTPALRDLIGQYFTYINEGNLTAAWNVLTANQQAGFTDFDGFTSVWVRIPHVEIFEFTGCTAASAPAFCHFIADYTTTKGGVRRTQVLFEIVNDAGALKVNSSSVDFLKCAKKNPGENGCSVA